MRLVIFFCAKPNCLSLSESLDRLKRDRLAGLRLKLYRGGLFRGFESEESYCSVGHGAMLSLLCDDGGNS